MTAPDFSPSPPPPPSCGPCANELQIKEEEQCEQIKQSGCDTTNCAVPLWCIAVCMLVVLMFVTTVPTAFIAEQSDRVIYCFVSSTLGSIVFMILFQILVGAKLEDLADSSMRFVTMLHHIVDGKKQQQQQHQQQKWQLPATISVGDRVISVASRDEDVDALLKAFPVSATIADVRVLQERVHKIVEGFVAVIRSGATYSLLLPMKPGEGAEIMKMRNPVDKMFDEPRQLEKQSHEEVPPFWRVAAQSRSHSAATAANSASKSASPDAVPHQKSVAVAGAEPFATQEEPSRSGQRQATTAAESESRLRNERSQSQKQVQKQQQQQQQQQLISASCQSSVAVAEVQEERGRQESASPAATTSVSQSAADREPSSAPAIASKSASVSRPEVRFHFDPQQEQQQQLQSYEDDDDVHSDHGANHGLASVISDEDDLVTCVSGVPAAGTFHHPAQPSLSPRPLQLLSGGGDRSASVGAKSSSSRAAASPPAVAPNSAARPAEEESCAPQQTSLATQDGGTVSLQPVQAQMQMQQQRQSRSASVVEDWRQESLQSREAAQLQLRLGRSTGSTSSHFLNPRAGSSLSGAEITPLLSLLRYQRGRRFPGDNVDLCFFIARSKNQNVVVFETKYDQKHGALDISNPIDAYWLDVDPAFMEKRRRQHKLSDRTELTPNERSLAYGVTITVDPDDEGMDPVFTVVFVALPTRPMKLSLLSRYRGTLLDRGAGGSFFRNSIPVLRCKIAGVDGCIAERLFLHCSGSEYGLGPARVTSVELHGFRADTLESVSEIMMTS